MSVIQRHVVPIVNVEILRIEQFAHVYQNLLVHHLNVGHNALLTVNVVSTKRVLTRNVSILVLVLAEIMQDVK